jgi:hypothetical protein
VFDPEFVARRLDEEWTLLLDGKLPPLMRAAANLFAEASYAQAPPAHFDTTGVTVENIGEKIEAVALALAVADKHNEARKQAQVALAHRVIAAATAAVPEIVEELKPTFDKAVQRYVAAVEKLPARFTADELLGAPEVEEAHREACDAAKDVKRIDVWLASTADLPGHGSSERHSVLRVVSASSRSELKALLDSEKAKHSVAEQKVVPMYRTAVELGLEWRMATAAEATAARREIDSTPVPRSKFVTLR